MNAASATDHSPTPQRAGPLISVITASYNAAGCVKQCIDSVLSQRYKNYEHIIIDGGSSDGTVSILRKYGRSLAYWKSEPDRGIYDAWNKGLSHSRGEWILFLGADDYFWDNNVLEQVAERLEALPTDSRVVYGQVALINSSGDVLAYAGKPWSETKPTFIHLMALPHQGVFHRRSLFEVHGNFDERFRIAGDYELLLRELKTHDALFLPDLVIAGMQQGGISSDPSQSLCLLTEIRMAHQKVLDGRTGWVWWMAYCRVRLRQLLWRLMGEQAARHILDALRICMGKPRYWTKTQ